jgi:ABC-type cobalamin/Fe3+-siderophores transport system ATPase subunit
MDIVAEHALLDLVAELRDQLDLGVVMISHQLSLVASSAKEVLLVDRDRGLQPANAPGERFALVHGPVEEVVTARRLSQLYGRPVVVNDFGGHKEIHLEKPAGKEAP